jgi:beta-carotene 3-hydroxylase
MEFMAWFTHKFVMHGFYGIYTRSSHVPNRDTFLKKICFLDLCGSFLVVYNVSSMYAVWPVMYIGFGILAYGIAYFLVHEIHSSKI